jgi:NTP pyrophosphatase (non-canonical NTP hydrolase)
MTVQSKDEADMIINSLAKDYYREGGDPGYFRYKAIEECGELIQALAKESLPVMFAGQRATERAHTLDEVFDVQLQLEKLKLVYGEEAWLQAVNRKFPKAVEALR